jgi:long-chain acyl-CoA synthetase
MKRSKNNSDRFFSNNTFISDFSNLIELQQKSLAAFSDRKFLGVRNGNVFDWMTYKEFNRDVEKFRKVLKYHFDITENDKVAIISNNRVEWAVCAYAALGLGAQIVPM